MTAPAALALRLATVRRLHPLGCSFTPLHGKKAYLDGWQARPRETLADAEAWARDGNIGVRTGASSGGILLVDVDTSKGATIPHEAGVDTWTTRTGSGSLHLWFRLPPGIRIGNPSKVWGQGSHVEIKCDGGQVVAPGSIHPDTGGVYAWEPGKSPEDLDLAPAPAELLARIAEYEAAKCAAGASATAGSGPRPATSSADVVERARRYLKKMNGAVSGQHGHDAAFHAACRAVEGFALDPETALALLMEPGGWNARCEPPWTEKELRHKVADALKHATRVGYLLDGSRAAKRRLRPGTRNCTAAGLSSDSHDSGSDCGDARPTVRCGAELHATTSKAEEVLAGIPAPRVFSRARRLVVVAREGAPRVPGVERRPGAPFVHALDNAAVREHLSRGAKWESKDKRTGEWRPCFPPTPAVAALVGRGAWESLPPLVDITEAPMFRPDGSILWRPGYDEATGILFDARGIEYPPVPESPSPAEVAAAVALLLEPFAQFEWEEPAVDLAVVGALILTLVARPAFDRASPCFAFDSTTRGSGKGLASDVAVLAATGKTPDVSILSPEPEEQRKALFAMTLEGHQTVLLDNLVSPLGGAVLSAILTSGAIRDRVLGGSSSAVAPFRAVLLATGNNLRFMGDFDRRALVARQRPTVEDPEDRVPPGGYRHADLRDYARKSHPQLLAAALTILRAYHVAGRPDHRLKAFGSFESWDALVRGACIWAKIGDPLACRERIKADSDDDRERIGTLLGAWQESIGSTATTLQGAVEHARATKEAPGCPALRQALAAYDAKGDADRPNVASIANRLKGDVGRIVGGRRLERVGKGSPVVYRVGLVGLGGLHTAGEKYARVTSTREESPTSPPSPTPLDRSPGEEG